MKDRSWSVMCAIQVSMVPRLTQVTSPSDWFRMEKSRSQSRRMVQPNRSRLIHATTWTRTQRYSALICLLYSTFSRPKHSAVSVDSHSFGDTVPSVQAIYEEMAFPVVEGVSTTALASTPPKCPCTPAPGRAHIIALWRSFPETHDTDTHTAGPRRV